MPVKCETLCVSCVLILHAVCVVLSIENEAPTEGRDGKVQWMLMPKYDGGVQVAVLSGIEPKVAPNLIGVSFLLYSRDNLKEPESRTMDPECLPVFKNFNPRRPTKILVHGFGDSSATSFMYPLLRDAFLRREDLNVVTVDWAELAATPWYGSAASNTVPVARQIASLIDHLIKSTGADINDFHLVGFSLGAHVVGLAGQFLTAGKLKRITGLDPAQVLFTESLPNKRLDATDAELVEILHTSGGYLGYLTPLGHRDFYPNGGAWPQPGCVLDFVAVCSHRRAYYYYAEALATERAFRSVPCPDYDQYVAGNCTSADQGADIASNDLDLDTKGNFFFFTNTQEPYAQPSPSVNQVR